MEVKVNYTEGVVAVHDAVDGSVNAHVPTLVWVVIGIGVETEE